MNNIKLNTGVVKNISPTSAPYTRRRQHQTESNINNEIYRQNKRSNFKLVTRV